MTEHIDWNEWNRFIEELQRPRPELSYRHHPERSRLAEYASSVDGGIPDVAQLAEAPDGDLQAWLEGASGWSSSAVSMHALTCSICRRRIELIRQEQLAPAAAASSPWWQPISEAVSRTLATPHLRRAATVGVIGIVFLSLAFSLMPDGPPNTDNSPPLPVERHEPRGGGIG